MAPEPAQAIGQVQEIREAIKAGPEAAARVIAEADPVRDPFSPDAKAAVDQLVTEAEQRQAAIEQAQLSGAMPTFHRGRDGTWTVYDGGTSAEIGKAPTMDGALRLAAAHGAMITERGPRAESAEAELERSASDPDGQREDEAADSPANVFGTIYRPIASSELTDWEQRALRAAERDVGRSNVRVVKLAYENRPGKRRALRAERLAEEIFRKKIVFVKTAGGKQLPFEAFVNPEDANTIIVDVDSRAGLSYLLGHELGHSIQHQQPDLYDAFQKELLAMAEDWSDYREKKLRGHYKTEAQFEAEFTNDFIGSQMYQPEFWNRLKLRNPGVFTRMVGAALDFLKTIGTRIGILERDVRPYFKDIEKARTALVEMLEEYQRGAMPDQSVRKRELGDAPDNELSASGGRRLNGKVEENDGNRTISEAVGDGKVAEPSRGQSRTMDGASPKKAEANRAAQGLGRIRMKNNYLYIANDKGRVIKTGGYLRLNFNQTRDIDSQRRAGGEDWQPGDHGGHFWARIFDGPSGGINLFAQDPNFNLSAYKIQENKWRSAKEAGKSVYAVIDAFLSRRIPTPRSLGDPDLDCR
ncbi:DNA/RNA non-specific endonuclease [Luteolibacter sp. Populi]|uniref:DNA/RNA non-specific endonuclease n=1 Tax=Luteolibacter sp. Populi TaxID=3230487 RepID=UPI003465F6A3